MVSLSFGAIALLSARILNWQKHRLGPAAALFKLAQTYLRKYPATYEALNVKNVLVMTDEWLRQLTAVPSRAFPPPPTGMPQLRLEAPRHGSDRHDGTE